MEQKEYKEDNIFEERISLEKDESKQAYQSVLEDIEESEEETKQEDADSKKVCQYANLNKAYNNDLKVNYEVMNVIDIKEEQHKEKDQKGKILEETSFKAYVNKGKNEEKNPIIRWIKRLFKICLICMLLPVAGIIGIGCIGIIGSYITGTLSLFAGGIFSLICGAFFATQITGEMTALCIVIGITAISGGVLFTLLFIMFFKWLLRCVRSLKK